MRPPLEGPRDASRSLPEFWREQVQKQLAADETILAWFEPDLDQRLCFARRLVVLTDRRLFGYGETEPAATRIVSSVGQRLGRPADDLTACGGNAPAMAIVPHCHERLCRKQMSCGPGARRGRNARSHHGRSPPGPLEIHAGAAAAAHRFVGRFQDVKIGSSGSVTTICPSCGATITSAMTESVHLAA